MRGKKQETIAFKSPQGKNLRQKLLASLVCLQLVDVLHEDAFVFEDVTFGLQVETVVPTRHTIDLWAFLEQAASSLIHIIHWHIHYEWGNSHLHVPVNFLWLPVATEKATQDSHSPHPYQFLRHTGIGCSLSFTWDRSKIKHRITTRKNKTFYWCLGRG